MSDLLWAIAIAIALNGFVCLYRAARGPTIQDRLLGINMLDTKVLVVLLISFCIIDRPSLYLDIALLYALLNFVITVAMSRYLETKRGPLA